jgi:predicted RNA binding protein YcfA (HicA-like mRNA interferase family)
MRPASGKAFCKALERQGWVFYQVRGSHHRYESPDRRLIVSVPVHGNRELKPGTQRALMRQTGLTDADL